MKILSLIAALVLISPAAIGQTVEGRMVATDGDSLRIGEERIRLYGIDAPELDQTCLRPDGGVWRCGGWSQRQLREVIRGQDLRCEGRERDRYGRLVATCFAGGRDVAEEMVTRGAAFAYRRYAMDYVDAEKGAAIADRGLWAADVQSPAAFRAGKVAPSSPAPEGCEIKGNISASGRIYHMPGQADYNRTGINTAKGERWFCSEDAARAAGWRRARR
ncbi:thermonuclease family protein [Alphaproteobacteria bacterium KMM 3653]|uniref:Thermonuclease family protein n=1 Tax=Harenicola maris TaxID=2841044 RepID=A0AAP2CMV2_9RHOB|nr:thermonuclease family protein [Harenicola maris]